MEESKYKNLYEVKGEDGNVYGPESDSTIRRWYFEKRLNAQSLIRCAGDTNWRQVLAYKEFKVSANEIVSPISKPGVIFWYRIYCSFSGVFAGLLVLLFLVLRSLPDMEQNMSPSDFDEFQITSLLMVVIGIPCAIFYFSCSFMTYKGWHWVLGLISIGLGMTGCCLPACIPLLIFWVKPETKRWLNRNE